MNLELKIQKARLDLQRVLAAKIKDPDNAEHDRLVKYYMNRINELWAELMKIGDEK